ncbi:PAS domain-containing sensor histidine kinase [Kordiimonas sediminis]|uniref:histidine kinase n=1 Tax=Kordiimonas sediminis TaxID=1735581 RepID=A0A919EAD2_9PROT|nr:PAS domain-containing sensor histidine kinase [Kordiimonas sediminis]GHF28223.1 PAS domain-containing sensor histidine kinase [Kordiimonas sediminis]
MAIMQRDQEQKISAYSKNKSPDLMYPGKAARSRRLAKLMLWARHVKLVNKLEVLVVVLAVVAAIATYITMSRKDAPFEVTSGRTMGVLLYVNFTLLLLLVALIGRWFARVWFDKRTRAAGSRLHRRVTGVFITIAIIPPIIMAVFSALFLEYGIQSWFSEKVRSVLNNSLEVAEGYMVEHRASIEQDMLAIAFAFNNLSPLEQRDSITLQKVADSALTTRLLSEVIVAEVETGAMVVLARASQGLELSTNRIPIDVLNRVESEESVVATNTADNTMIAMVRLRSFFEPTYLYVSRDLNPQVVEYLANTRTAVTDYATMEGQRTDIQLQFNVVFIVVALLILLAAIWAGLWFSSRLVTPLSYLVDAAERVGQGDYGARVPSLPSTDEVGMLSRAFNRMTDQLTRHQKDLLAANLELDERRRFLEEVLEGVSAGVIGLQKDKRVFLPNKSACQLLGKSEEDLIGQTLDVIAPEFSDLLKDAEDSDELLAMRQIQLEVGDAMRTLLVRISVEQSEGNLIGGYVMTFDDLTDQLADQRTAAWADVARRIAHEIKNPLTPIQLSAERLKRKYGKEIVTDPAIFGQCTDTIIRQVGDLRRMVDEFSSFARMPTPIYRETDVVDIIRQSVFLQGVAWSDVIYRTNFPDNVDMLMCDGRLLGQAVTNLLKNAAESVEARLMRDRKAGSDTIEPGMITVTVQQSDDTVDVLIEDNGLGLPQEQRDRLMEPYVTTRAKGTGLGLAIVRKIIEEHSGSIKITDRSPIGARAMFSLSAKALVKKAQKDSEKADMNAAE